MQRDGGDEHALGDEPGDQLGGERPAGARHLGAAGLERVHVLVRGQGPATGHVAVANRMPVRGQIRLERLSDIEAREPEPDARVRSEDPGEATVGQSQPVTDVNPTERPALGPKLDDPEALLISIVRRSREMQLERRTVRA